MKKFVIGGALALAATVNPAWAQADRQVSGRDLTHFVAGNFTMDDYPLPAIRAGESGRLVMDITVRADGSVADCAVVQSSGSDSLDTRSCEIALERFRYAPWVPTEGRPRETVMRQAVVWQLPRREESVPGQGAEVAASGFTRILNEMTRALSRHPVPYENANFSISINALIGPGGRVTDCAAEIHGAWFEPFRGLCPLLQELPTVTFSPPGSTAGPVEFRLIGRWNLAPEPASFAPAEGYHGVGRVLAKFDLDATGAVVRCTYMAVLPSRDVPEDTCGGGFPPWRFDPPLGADGARLATGQMTLTLILESDRDMMPVLAPRRSGRP